MLTRLVSCIISAQLYPVTFILLTGYLSFLCPCSVTADIKDWTHFSIADSLPGTEWGTGGTPLADFDGDGDLDISVSRREMDAVYWYQRVDDATWIRHTITTGNIENKLGATAVDCDLDGFVDVVYPNLWFKNSGNLKAQPDATWERHEYSGEGHDILSGDINGNGHLDVITYDGKTLQWFDTSAHMRGTEISRGYDHHGGTAPKGIGDLDGDGDNDVVIPGYWFENQGNGYGNWTRHEWPHEPIINASYGTSTRCWVIDINKDGWQDIIYSDCDTGYSHVYWVQNNGQGAAWTRHLLTDPSVASGDVPETGSFHSLGVADFDLDGDLDIFAGEQEDPDIYMVEDGKLPMKPVGLKERGVIWENNGASEPAFTPVIIQLDNPGWHDAVLGDVDYDGDIDIVSKVWNKDGSTYHADFWRNDIKSAPPSR